jgi:hypothetical protein
MNKRVPNLILLGFENSKNNVLKWKHALINITMTYNYNEWMSSIVRVFTINCGSQNSHVAYVISPPIAKWSFPQHQWEFFF